MTKQGACVLIVDDEQAILDSLEDLLEDSFPVVTVSDPELGLKALREHEVGVILSDQRMPRMQGHEFLAEASKLSRATRVLITGYTDMNALVKAVNRGKIYAFISKPWEPSHLKSLIHTGMEHYNLTQELRYEQHLMTNLMNTVPEPVAFISLTGEIFRVNKAAANLLGLDSEDEARGLFVEDLKRANPTLEPFLSPVPTQDRIIASILNADQEPRWHSILRVPYGPQEGVICVSHDVTERHETEIALAKQASELELSRREIHQFAHVTAHHLQEPLRDVASHLQLLRLNILLDQGNQEALDFAVDGARRMKALFSDFIRYIDLSVEDSRQKTHSLKSILEVAMSRGLQQANFDYEIKMDDPSADLTGNRDLLLLLFGELLSNATKFRSEEPLKILVHCEERPGEWWVSFSDNGLGIGGVEAERIFGLFQRLHSQGEYPGTGLGLALCRKIATLHQGRIWAQANEPAQGLTVTLSVPRREET